ncbi:MAG: glycosyl transferase [Lachnospiraceae bacterium]|nr:glycosyl transferase [Lachnospiraceae bacterium]
MADVNGEDRGQKTDDLSGKERRLKTGTVLMQGQGLGNRLFSYVSARCMAEDSGEDFFISGAAYLPDFLPGLKEPPVVLLEEDCSDHRTGDCNPVFYHEKEERIYIKDCVHDMVHGCFTAGADPDILNAREKTGAGDRPLAITGNLQAEGYFSAHREEIKQWLKIPEEYDNKSLSAENICILNLRCGEYVQENALYLRRSYWLKAMRYMRNIRADMDFHIVTDDPKEAAKLLPGIPVHHGEVSDDYTMIRNARYLIVSNSSFAFFPAYTSDKLVKAVAPMYWARHNTSDGFWASEQNIYSIFSYMDRRGDLYTPEECRHMLSLYREKAGEKLSGKTPFDSGSIAVRVRKTADRMGYLSRRGASKIMRAFTRKTT